ncbi:hypothetical protein HAX54_053314 [Datura stramonium]|uniref:Uncharacterized protein n=1 Tax=Datura stramonium TaxID=4076 RepID=A0ABS8T0T8_DATST|nr:hypothetical protein [Datura stramonium]
MTSCCLALTAFYGFLGSSGNQSARKVLAVLGEGSAEKPRRKLRMLENIEKPSTLFDHYANGGVGCNEVWEGMGSTTLGGLE